MYNADKANKITLKNKDKRKKDMIKEINSQIKFCTKIGLFKTTYVLTYDDTKYTKGLYDWYCDKGYNVVVNDRIKDHIYLTISWKDE